MNLLKSYDDQYLDKKTLIEIGSDDLISINTNIISIITTGDSPLTRSNPALRQTPHSLDLRLKVTFPSLCLFR